MLGSGWHTGGTRLGWVEVREEGGKWWEIKTIFRDLLRSLKHLLHPNTCSYAQQVVENMSPELRSPNGLVDKEMGIVSMEMSSENHASEWGGPD